MRHLQTFNELATYDDIDVIIDRIQSTGYISKSQEEKLIELSGDPNIVKKVYQKVSKLQAFYKKATPEYFSDVMLSLLDDTPYKYKIQIGFYLPKNYRYYSCRDSDMRTTRWLPNDLNKTDSQKTLLSHILKAIKDYNIESGELAKKSKEEAKTRPSWTKEPRSRHYSGKNYFKQIQEIQPQVRIEVIHKLSEEIWYYDWYELEDLKGFDSKEFAYENNPDSLLSKINKSRRLLYLGRFKAHVNAWICSYTDRKILINEEPVEYWENPKPILTHGYVDLNFNI